MIRTLSAAALVAALGSAPFQCHRDPDPNLRREDDAGDALYALAQDFHTRGDDSGYRQTLRFLVERYPSNRHAPEARKELEASSSAAVKGGLDRDAGR